MPHIFTQREDSLVGLIGLVGNYCEQPLQQDFISILLLWRSQNDVPSLKQPVNTN